MSTLQHIVDRARVPLNDAAAERYTDAELLGYAKDGIREAAILRPDLFSIVGQVNCIAGVDQSLPAGGWLIVDVIANHLGDEVLEADYTTFRGFNPGWRNDPPGAPQSWMRYPDKGPNKRFMVHPPARVGDQLDVIFVQLDVNDLELTSPIPVDEPYWPALEFYVGARAEAKDDQHSLAGHGDKLRAQYATMLGIGASTEKGGKK